MSIMESKTLRIAYKHPSLPSRIASQALPHTMPTDEPPQTLLEGLLTSAKTGNLPELQNQLSHVETEPDLPVTRTDHLKQKSAIRSQRGTRACGPDSLHPPPASDSRGALGSGSHCPILPSWMKKASLSISANSNMTQNYSIFGAHRA